MAKRRTQADMKQALRQRIADIAAGAGCCDFDTTGGCMALLDLPRFLAALKVRLPLLDEPGNQYMLGHSNLDALETLDEATEHLWTCDIRA